MPTTITKAQFDAAVMVMMQPRMHTNGSGDKQRADLLAALNALGIEVLERYGDLRG